MTFFIKLEYYDEGMAQSPSHPGMTRTASCRRIGKGYRITTRLPQDVLYEHWNNLNDRYGLVVACVCPPGPYTVSYSYLVPAVTLQGLFNSSKDGDKWDYSLTPDPVSYMYKDDRSIQMLLRLRRTRAGLFVRRVTIWITELAFDDWLGKYVTFQRQTCEHYWASH